MPRKTNKIEVATRFENLLRRKLPEFENRIYWRIGEEPPADAVRDRELITFCFTGGHFDHPNQVGGILDYDGSIRVRVWSTNYSDQSGENRELLLSTPLGLYDIEARLLLIQDDFLGDGDATDLILTEGIKALSDETSNVAAEDENNTFIGVLSVDFGVNFQWDLTADE
jgi:hypothetical protein